MHKRQGIDPGKLGIFGRGHKDEEDDQHTTGEIRNLHDPLAVPSIHKDTGHKPNRRPGHGEGDQKISDRGRVPIRHSIDEQNEGQVG